MAEHRPGDLDVHDIGKGAPSGPPGDPDHDVNTKLLWRVGIGLAVGTVVACAAMLGVFFFEKTHLDRQDPIPSPMAEARVARPPAGPRLQKDPTEELNAFRASEEKALATYGWTDKAAGLARVPASRAAEIVLAQGVAPLNPPPAEEEAAK